ncbi:lipid-binding SYLF domain-containing protein [Methylotetracoccus oryzae]|uniref:lipid-binding SYLF domain-containing protein n=1 Tax=Methylotetracoccus oryzae TaxID=1919059 RepID=UPI00111B9BE7|nr:lipid-binding SYLF domain-containing protein [Methylotetracoccus oryzae]
MRSNRMLACILALTGLLLLNGCQSLVTGRSGPEAAAEIDRSVDAALQRLYATTPKARELAKRASGILVFPGVVRAGFIGGAKFGTGALRERGRTSGYYNVVAGSYGLQAGVQSYDYAMFFMTPKALDYLKESQGWEVGSGPTLVVVDSGVANAMTTTTLRSDVYTFISSQKGLMAGLGLQGSKITRFEP